MMAYNQCLGITLMQLFNQFSQRSLLCFRPGVFRRCSAIIQSAYVAYTYTVTVVVLAMCSNQLFRASGISSGADAAASAAAGERLPDETKENMKL